MHCSCGLGVVSDRLTAPAGSRSFSSIPEAQLRQCGAASRPEYGTSYATPGVASGAIARPSRRSCAVQNDLAHGGGSSPRFLAVRARPLDVLDELASVSGEPHRQLRETGPSDWALARAPELASRASNTGATGGRGCGPNTTQEFSLRRPGNLKVRPVFGASGAGAVVDDEHAAVRIDRAAAVKRGAVDDERQRQRRVGPLDAADGRDRSYCPRDRTPTRRVFPRLSLLTWGRT
jgi:hypothetical protein